MEVAYYTLSDKKLYVKLDKLLEGPKPILAPLQNYWGGGGLAPAAPSCSYAYVKKFLT